MSKSKLKLKQVIHSVLAAFIGVQSGANLKRDFENESFSSYIVVGIIMAVLFVVMLVTIVSLVV